MSEKISKERLVQLVLVRKDLNMSSLQTGEQVAKASVGLITRCFESSKRFLGNYERNAYQSVIMAWIDDFDQDRIVLEVDNEDELDAYLFTAEFSDIPTQLVKDSKGKINPACPVTALAVGPYDRRDIFSAFDDIIPEDIINLYVD